MRALLLLAVLGACTGAMETYFAQDVVDIERDITYVPGSIDARQRLDLYIPRDATSAPSGVPVVVFIHGGFWMRQDKSFFEPFVGLYGNVGRALARRGIATAVIDYRLVPSVAFRDQLADIARAVAWVQSNIAARGGNPAHIVIAGHSAGGHLTALAAVAPSRLATHGVDPTTLRGFAPLSPILDLAALAAFSADDAATVSTVFGTDTTTFSPHTYFRADLPPLQIFLGSDDLAALLAQVPPAVDELLALGAPVEYHLLPGIDHEDIVLQIDTDDDPVTPLLEPFVRSVAP